MPLSLPRYVSTFVLLAARVFICHCDRLILSTANIDARFLSVNRKNDTNELQNAERKNSSKCAK